MQSRFIDQKSQLPRTVKLIKSLTIWLDNFPISRTKSKLFQIDFAFFEGPHTCVQSRDKDKTGIEKTYMRRRYWPLMAAYVRFLAGFGHLCHSGSFLVASGHSRSYAVIVASFGIKHAGSRVRNLPRYPGETYTWQAENGL